MGSALRRSVHSGQAGLFSLAVQRALCRSPIPNHGRGASRATPGRLLRPLMGRLLRCRRLSHRRRVFLLGSRRDAEDDVLAIFTAA